MQLLSEKVRVSSPNLAGLGSSGEGETLSGDEAPLHLLGLVNTQISKYKASEVEAPAKKP